MPHQATTYPANPIHLPETADRATWLEQRRRGVGSSDASTIVGLNPYASPYSLWCEKTGRTPLDVPVPDQQQEAMDWGNRLEPLILDETAHRLGVRIVKPGYAIANRDRPWQHTNLDGWTADGRIFEAKTTHPRNAAQWEGQIPDHAEVQVHHAAAVTGATHAIVAGLIGGQHLSIHEITINPHVVEMVTEAETRFWRCVETDTPPDVDGHRATLDALTREWAHHTDVCEVAEADALDAWTTYQDAAADEKTAAARKRAAQARLAQLLDGHDVLATGDRIWAKARRGQINLRRLTADHPDLVAEYTHPKPTFDRAGFKSAHPDLAADYQSVSIHPTTA